MEVDELAERLAAVERRLAALEAGRTDEGVAADVGTAAIFWALDGLKRRLPDKAGAVLFTGSVQLPAGDRYDWQEGISVEDLLAREWADAAAALTALAHPVRLVLLREVLAGCRSTAELQTHERLGTTGQLYHHLRLLTGAGWLRTTSRGQVQVPPDRVIPLLVVLAAVGRRT